jgi:hypothetical protein
MTQALYAHMNNKIKKIKKRYSVLLLIREVEIKATTSRHYTHDND